MEAFSSVFDALAESPEDAANLKARADLMRQVVALIEASGWTQKEAAAHCQLTLPRLDDLLRGRASRFSLDALMSVAAALEQPPSPAYREGLEC